MLRGAPPSVRTFASLAMPTTSQGGSSSRRRTSRPTASPSVQQRRAMASLMMTTGWGVQAVGVVEVAPAEDLDAYHLEELRLDRGPVCDEGAVVCRRLEPVDVEVARLVLSGFRCRLLMAPIASTPGSAPKRSSRRRV